MTQKMNRMMIHNRKDVYSTYMSSSTQIVPASVSVKRKLTPAEIESVFRLIPIQRGIPIETAECIRNGIISSIDYQLRSIEIYPEMIPKLFKIIEQEYHMSLLQPGEMVGVQAATSIGEPVSQMTLNAFHFSGISSIGIASGVPRVEELLNASKKQKSTGMTLYFKDHKSILEHRRDAFSSIKEVYLQQMIMEYTVSYVSKRSDIDAADRPWYDLYQLMYETEIMDAHDILLPWRIRFVMNKEKMYQHSVSCATVASKIEDSYRDLYCIPSPDNIGIVDVFINFSHMKLKKKESDEIADLGDLKEHLCITNIILPYILDVLISGISDVEDLFIREESVAGGGAVGGIGGGKEWVVDTQGSNLSSAFANDLLDATRCTSSDIWEIRKLLGIEATRQFIINEFYKVLSASGASVGRRHIELLADSMTFQGKINSVNRYGIDRKETGPLAKASFEESVNNFFIAAVNGETDEMGVSSSIMAGKMAEFGSGYCDLHIKMDINTPTFEVPVAVTSLLAPKNTYKPPSVHTSAPNSSYRPPSAPISSSNETQNNYKPESNYKAASNYKAESNYKPASNYKAQPLPSFCAKPTQHIAVPLPSKLPLPTMYPIREKDTLKDKVVVPKKKEVEPEPVKTEKISWVKKKKVAVAFSTDE